MANLGNLADSADPSGVQGAYTNAKMATRLPTVTSETLSPAAMSGRMPTTTNSLMPNMKLAKIRMVTGRLKKRSVRAVLAGAFAIDALSNALVPSTTNRYSGYVNRFPYQLSDNSIPTYARLCGLRHAMKNPADRPIIDGVR